MSVFFVSAPTHIAKRAEALFQKDAMFMKTLLVGPFVLAPIAALGCGKGVPATLELTSSAPAAPEKQSNPVAVVAEKPILGEADNTFSLSVPFESIVLAQGEETSVLISPKRFSSPFLTVSKREVTL